jgi:hypothetical protein
LVVDSGGDVDASSLGNVPPSNDASALTAGTLPIARIPDGAIPAAKLASGVLPVPNVYRIDNTLRSSIQTTSGSFTDNISAHLTPRTYAVILRVNYIHNGSNNHGYWSANFYQSGKDGDNKNIFKFTRAHFNWYFNDFWVEHVLPWDIAGSPNLVANVLSGLFTGDNRYSYGIAGVLER